MPLLSTSDVIAYFRLHIWILSGALFLLNLAIYILIKTSRVTHTDHKNNSVTQSSAAPEAPGGLALPSHDPQPRNEHPDAGTRW